MRQFKFIISGGGTGGHIYPAISISNELKLRYPNSKIVFVGARDRMEMQIVPKHGFEIIGLWISGFTRSLSLKNFIFPIKLLTSLLRSLFIIKYNKPDVVIGTGGFASGPILYIASLFGIPTLIQEQNSYPGITNKILAKRASKICVAYDNLDRFFDKNKLILTGNPVRSDLQNLAIDSVGAALKFGLEENKKTLLIIGGSNGSREINKLIFNNLNLFESLNIQLLWQCGKIYYEHYKKLNNNKNIKVYDFIDKMNLAYEVADIIISRAGASSISELCIVGKPVIFLPSPNVAEDHQSKNALSLVNNKAALMIEEKNMNKDFKNSFSELINDRELQNELSRNIKKQAKINATRDIVNEIEKLL
ncbi:MAG: UDP-N-acetylglucosamine--N-acetylmuramyl-(pentapeptide) pyrophosphoryl-undecaprenol N-acetylglucosamine transferase [Flavobacteriaceae bacterium]|jgi:UDP-N-acetylglucosamine--N-acetylmuramyl-(pentapeptide) pyrophosphoryl-undecaprenol N-acetylglucosamine transferase|tara:strand:+ start:2040 stop:3128 length:1089 start_codon:yes stop_codon:yes gene_type:complete